MSLPVRSPQGSRVDLRPLWRSVRAYATDPAHIALWAIVLFAAALRLARLDLVEFKADEAGHLLRALQVVEEHRLPLVGSQASVGIDKPPMMTLLMALPLLLGRDPRLASGFIALLNVGAVAGCFLVARRYYNLRVAVVAGALFAANPWAVIFSRKVFTADVLAPFLVLYLYALHAAVVDRRGHGWLLAVLSLGLMLSITFSPLPLALVLLALIVAYRRQVNWRQLLLGAGLAGLLFVPYLYAQLGRLQGLKALLQTMLGSVSSGDPGVNPLQAAIWLHSGDNLGSLAGAAFDRFAPAQSALRALHWLAGLVFALALPGVLGLTVEAWLRKEERAGAGRYAVLALWLFISLAVVSLGITRIQVQYLVILYPAGFLAMALLVDRAWAALGAGRGAWQRWARLGRLCLGILLSAVVLWQAYSVLYLYGFVAQHDTAGGYGVPLRCWLDVSAMARREAAAANVDEIWAITDGADIAYEQTPVILHYLLGPELKVIFLGQGGNEAMLLPVDRPALYLLTRPVPSSLEAMLDRLEAEERGVQPGCQGSGPARIVFVPGRPASSLASLVPRRTEERVLDSGLVLLGYDWPDAARPGERVRFATYWGFRETPPAERSVGHSLLNHLLAADDRKVAQHDGFGLPERYWRPGLMLVQWFEMELPEDTPVGEYTLLTGMYRLSDFSANHVLDEANNPAGDSIRLGPVRVGD